MNEADVLAGFQALSQALRLRILRVLIEAVPGGLPAGQISASLGCTASNASFHLAALARAGLVRSRREGRSIIYAAATEQVGALIDYLMEDCCGDRPQLCRPSSEPTLKRSCREAACQDEVG